MADQPKRTPSTDELDYQRRLDEDFAPETRSTTGEPTVVYSPYAVEGNDTTAYVGVSPEYMTYASETEAPQRAEEGVEKDREERVFGNRPLVAAASVSPFDADTSTRGGGASSDLAYTATSGEGYTAEKAVGAKLVVEDEEQAPEDVVVKRQTVPTQEPTEPTATPANTKETPNPAPPTPAAKTSGAKVTSDN